MGDRGQRACLFFEREPPVQWEHFNPSPTRIPRKVLQQLGGSTDFAHPWQKRQDMAVGRLLYRATHRTGDLSGQRRCGSAGQVLHIHRKPTTARGHEGCVIAEQLLEGLGVERGRHHHNPQLGPGVAPQIGQQRHGQIEIETALVHFVEHHTRHVFEERVALDLAQQHALGHRNQPSTRAGAVFETHLPADGFPRSFPPLLGNPQRRQACSHPSRLYQPDTSTLRKLELTVIDGPKHRWRYPGGLSRSGGAR